jgi:hypothetical protein
MRPVMHSERRLQGAGENGNQEQQCGGSPGGRALGQEALLDADIALDRRRDVKGERQWFVGESGFLRLDIVELAKQSDIADEEATKPLDLVRWRVGARFLLERLHHGDMVWGRLFQRASESEARTSQDDEIRPTVG